MFKYHLIISLVLSQLFCNETNKEFENHAVKSKISMKMREVFNVTGKLLSFPKYYVRCGDEKIAVGFMFSIIESPHPLATEIVIIIPCPDHFGTEDFYKEGASYEVQVTKNRDNSFSIYNDQKIENLQWLWALKIKKLPN